jgi:hypothetical protein
MAQKMNPVQIQKFLDGIDYPANKQSLIDTARKNGADDKVMSMLNKLPDQDFNSPADVSRALGNLEGGDGGGE